MSKKPVASKPAAKAAPARTAAAPARTGSATPKPSTPKPGATKPSATKPSTGAAAKAPAKTTTKTTTTKPTSNSTTKAATTKPAAKATTPARPASKTPPKDAAKPAKPKSASKSGRSSSARTSSDKTVNPKDEPQSHPRSGGVAFEVGITNDDQMERPMSAAPPRLMNWEQNHPPRPSLTQDQITENIQKAVERKQVLDAAKLERIHALDADSKKLTDKLEPFVRELTSTDLGGDKIEN